MARKRALALAALMGAALLSGAALAHHGWYWAKGENSEITGVIQSARLGNPHGTLTLDVAGEEWTAEVGQPWRNARAGLEDDMLGEGVQVTVSGHRSKDPEQRLIKAERVIIDGVVYHLYPDRD